MQRQASNDTHAAEELEPRLIEALETLEAARPFSKQLHVSRLLDVAARLLRREGGTAVLRRHAHRFGSAGLFQDSDWQHPERLQAGLVEPTLDGADRNAVVLECLNLLRFLSVAASEVEHPEITAEWADDYLRQVLALNLDKVFRRETEAARARPLKEGVQAVFDLVVEAIGFENLMEQAAEEVWRLLRQRPIAVDRIKAMVTRIAVCFADPEVDSGNIGRRSERLISALFGPTETCQEDPGLGVYRERLAVMDAQALRQEARSMARAMHDTGLVSAYHAVLVQLALDSDEPELIATALGLSTTGLDAMLTYRALTLELLRETLAPEDPQVLYGLACLLERGTLYMPAIAPALWHQLRLQLHPDVEARLRSSYGPALSPRARLLSGVVMVLGLPLGVGQGDNPSCQSARAISIWAHDVPDYLLQLITWAARDDQIIMHFEGSAVSSKGLAAGLIHDLKTDLDPVSLILVPHLDRIYVEMGRMVVDRPEDAHKWVNPEFHGWRVGRGFAIAVEVATGAVKNLEDFLRHFYAMYHPTYNGGVPLIFHQPAGIAVTDSNARFVGWHAITITRVSLDHEEVMRVYFFNPNNDSTQDWGQGIVTSTEGHGELFGESSLPFEDFASRLYIFHYDPLEEGPRADVPQDELDRIAGRVKESWGAGRAWMD